MRIFLKFGSNIKQNFEINENANDLNGVNLIDLIATTFNLDDFNLCSTSGVDFDLNKRVNDGDTFILCPKVVGGKGGFGSLLRSFGKQITKSTNKDACRDLTGRRMRHVNRDKKLKVCFSCLYCQQSLLKV